MSDLLGPAEVVVVGAGRMGAGIAHAFLLSGARVQLRDVDADAVERGRTTVHASLQRTFSKGTASGSAAEAISRLETGVGLDEFGIVDLVVEAVPELPELKRSVLRQVSADIPKRTILATNTSSISVTDLASAVDNPERFLGMHFFNPVPVSALVEIVRAKATDETAVDLALAWTAAIGKHPIVVNDSPGFATSRLGLVIGLEAIRMLEEEVASAEDIDAGMTLGYGFPMGPLRLTDTVGLDIRLGIAEYLEQRLGPRFSPPALLREKVAAGELGRKTGRGFYAWPE